MSFLPDIISQQNDFFIVTRFISYVLLKLSFCSPIKKKTVSKNEVPLSHPFV